METPTHTAPPVDLNRDLNRLVRLCWDYLRYNRYTLFAGLVWRPVTGDAGDSWFKAWRKYRMSWQTAWEVACVIYPLPIADEMKVAELTKQRDGLQSAYDASLRQMNEAIANAEWYRTDAIVKLERERDELRAAIRNLRDVSGRHHTQIACERLFALLPEKGAERTRGANNQ